MVAANGDARLDYGTLDKQADCVAAFFVGKGMLPGETIALLCDNAVELVAIWWGARRAGLYYVPIATHLTAKEIGFIVMDSRARSIIASSRHIPISRMVTEDFAAADLWLATVDEIMSPREAIDAIDLRTTPVVGRELIYSSGTTGQPKGIRRALAIAESVQELPVLEQRMRDVFHIDSNTVYLSVSPLYHATGRFLNRVIEEGGTVVVLAAFDATNALAAIERHKVTNTQWVPTMFSRLLALPASVRQAFDLTSHRHALHAAAPCPERVKRAMLAWWGPIVDEYYGGTENAGVTFITACEWLDRPGSVGRSITGAIHIIDEKDGSHEMPVGEVGLITFEGGVPFTYLNQTSNVGPSTAHGFAGYGDLGHIDSDGYLFISDRRTDLIVTGGVNVYPKEVERVLEQHPSVAEVAVIGTPNGDLGQQVHAVVVVHDGATLVTEDLISFARTLLSPVKCPRRVDIAAALPRNENGKLLKRVLREIYSNEKAASNE